MRITDGLLKEMEKGIEEELKLENSQKTYTAVDLFRFSSQELNRLPGYLY